MIQSSILIYSVFYIHSFLNPTATFSTQFGTKFIICHQFSDNCSDGIWIAIRQQIVVARLTKVFR